MAFQKTLNRRLLKASQNGDTEDVQILLEAGANVHAVHHQALRDVKRRGHTETVKILEAAQESAKLKLAAQGNAVAAKAIVEFRPYSESDVVAALLESMPVPAKPSTKPVREWRSAFI